MLRVPRGSGECWSGDKAACDCVYKIVEILENVHLRDHCELVTYRAQFEVIPQSAYMSRLQKKSSGATLLCCGVCVRSYKHLLYQLLGEITAPFTLPRSPHSSPVITPHSVSRMVSADSEQWTSALERKNTDRETKPRPGR